MFFRFILFCLIATVVVRFIFRFLLPAFRITRSVSERMQSMQQQMQDMERNVRDQNRRPAMPKKGDYIEYEDVK